MEIKGSHQGQSLLVDGRSKTSSIFTREVLIVRSCTITLGCALCSDNSNKTRDHNFMCIPTRSYSWEFWRMLLTNMGLGRVKWLMQTLKPCWTCCAEGTHKITHGTHDLGSKYICGHYDASETGESS